jgi:endogenous inhibitor of DNA gyrase (YacG/DUF329 family)
MNTFIPDPDEGWDTDLGEWLTNIRTVPIEPDEEEED